MGIGLEEDESAGIDGDVDGTEVVVEVLQAVAEGVDGGGEGAQLGQRLHHHRILFGLHCSGIHTR